MFAVRFALLVLMAAVLCAQPYHPPFHPEHEHAAPTPEPGTFAVVGVAIAALIVGSKRRRG